VQHDFRTEGGSKGVAGLMGSQIESGKAVRPKRFMSLKWKTLYLSSFLFVSLTVGFLLVGRAYIQQQFVIKRDMINERFDNELRVLVEQSAQRLQQLGATVASLDSMSDAISTLDATEIGRVFDEHWWRYEIDGSIDSLAFYSTDSRQLVRWGINIDETGLVRRVVQEEKPQWQIICTNVCQIIAAVPLLVEGSFTTVVVLSTSFTDVILNFRSITGADIGVLVDAASVSDDALVNKRLWGRSLIALTGAKANIPLLEEFVLTHPQLMKANSRELFQYDNQDYEVAILPVYSRAIETGSRLVVISNVTDDVDSARRIMRNTIMGALVGLVASELILLLLLWRPTTQLRKVVDALPLLAENSFDIARQSFREANRQKLITDESDVLKTTALNLSYQLEALHSLLNNRAVQLEARGMELETEKNFVLGLLNTAHALILTQDVRGEVLMINHHGEKLTGLSSHDIIGHAFVTLLADRDDALEVSAKLKALFRSQINEVHHESMTINHGGRPRYMSWFHSRLPDRGEAEHLVLTVAIDISERRVAEENLGWLASHDSLTSLLNRRRFEDELEHVMAASQRYGHSGALLFFDLDQFKDVNDSSGHQVGDELLKRVADALRDTAREADIIARLGGDEFAILLQEADELSAGETAERFCRALMKIAVPGQNRIHRISASIGVALFPQHGKTPTEILANADIAMYQAKEAGRNTWSIFNEDQFGKERVNERVYWNDRVKQILSDDTFELYFQPIIDVATRTTSHYECLLRVPNETGDMISPVKFIAAAERGGLIQRMDELVISKAMGYQRLLMQRGIAARLSVNLSGLSFRNENLVAHIERQLTQYQIDPGHIIFEITETAAVADMEVAIDVVQQIRLLGCQFALDDFGVGFSSLHYLKRLPVDYLKIDGSFVSRLHVDRDDQVLVRALVTIATAFGQKTVAEFVDNEQILVTLAQLNVDYAQGFYIAKPAAYEQIWPDTAKLGSKAI